jgi:hypothetical protein
MIVQLGQKGIEDLRGDATVEAVVDHFTFEV